MSTFHSLLAALSEEYERVDRENKLLRKDGCSGAGDSGSTRASTSGLYPSTGPPGPDICPPEQYVRAQGDNDHGMWEPEDFNATAIKSKRESRAPLARSSTKEGAHLTAKNFRRQASGLSLVSRLADPCTEVPTEVPRTEGADPLDGAPTATFSSRSSDSAGGAGSHGSMIAEKPEGFSPKVRALLKWKKINSLRSSTAVNISPMGALGADMNMSQNRTSRWVINPERSTGLARWDMVTSVGLLFVATVTPVQVAMVATAFDVFFFVNLVVDLIFVVDLVLQFFIMYQKKVSYGYALEHRPKRIVSHYLRTWFCIDLVSIIPFDALALASESEDARSIKAVKVVRLLRLLKLVRVLKASRVFRRMEVRMSITYQRLALTKFFIVLALITHWMANVWAMTLILVDEEEGLPRWTDRIDALEENVELKTKDSGLKLYITCLYFTSYTITSVGYGDIGPMNFVERCICTLMIFVAGISWAIVLGQVASIMSNMDEDEQRFRKTMDELNYMLAERSIPMSIRRRLRGFFLSSRAAQSHVREKRILKQMSPGLQRELTMEINRLWIGKVSFLSDALKESESLENGWRLRTFVQDVSQELQFSAFAQLETFGVLQTLYILNRGIVVRKERLFQSGAIWGIDFVLSDLMLLEPHECVALTYIEVTHLSREAFMRAVEKHSIQFPALQKRVRRFCIWLAFQRAILAEAWRRQSRNDLLGCHPRSLANGGWLGFETAGYFSAAERATKANLDEKPMTAVEYARRSSITATTSSC